MFTCNVKPILLVKATVTIDTVLYLWRHGKRTRKQTLNQKIKTTKKTHHHVIHRYRVLRGVQLQWMDWNVKSVERTRFHFWIICKQYLQLFPNSDVGYYLMHTVAHTDGTILVKVRRLTLGWNLNGKTSCWWPHVHLVVARTKCQTRLDRIPLNT